MDFRILEIDGNQILIRRHVENGLQYVFITCFIKGDVDDPEIMYDDRIQFPSRDMALDFVFFFSTEAAENWLAGKRLA